VRTVEVLLSAAERSSPRTLAAVVEARDADGRDAVAVACAATWRGGADGGSRPRAEERLCTVLKLLLDHGAVPSDGPVASAIANRWLRAASVLLCAGFPLPHDGVGDRDAAGGDVGGGVLPLGHLRRVLERSMGWWRRWPLLAGVSGGSCIAAAGDMVSMELALTPDNAGTLLHAFPALVDDGNPACLRTVDGEEGEACEPRPVPAGPPGGFEVARTAGLRLQKTDVAACTQRVVHVDSSLVHATSEYMAAARRFAGAGGAEAGLTACDALPVGGGGVALHAACGGSAVVAGTDVGGTLASLWSACGVSGALISHVSPSALVLLEAWHSAHVLQSRSACGAVGARLVSHAAHCGPVEAAAVMGAALTTRISPCCECGDWRSALVVACVRNMAAAGGLPSRELEALPDEDWVDMWAAASRGAQLPLPDVTVALTRPSWQHAALVTSNLVVARHAATDAPWRVAPRPDAATAPGCDSSPWAAPAPQSLSEASAECLCLPAFGEVAGGGYASDSWGSYRAAWLPHVAGLGTEATKALDCRWSVVSALTVYDALACTPCHLAALLDPKSRVVDLPPAHARCAAVWDRLQTLRVAHAPLWRVPPGMLVWGSVASATGHFAAVRVAASQHRCVRSLATRTCPPLELVWPAGDDVLRLDVNPPALRDAVVSLGLASHVAASLAAWLHGDPGALSAPPVCPADANPLVALLQPVVAAAAVVAALPPSACRDAGSAFVTDLALQRVEGAGEDGLLVATLATSLLATSVWAGWEGVDDGDGHPWADLRLRLVSLVAAELRSGSGSGSGGGSVRDVAVPANADASTCGLLRAAGWSCIPAEHQAPSVSAILAACDCAMWRRAGSAGGPPLRDAQGAAFHHLLLWALGL